MNYSHFGRTNEEWYEEARDEERYEPIGSCGNCGCNLYDDDEYGGLCGQCEWFRQQNMPAQREAE